MLPDIEMSLERIHLSPLPGEKLWEFLLFGAKGSSSGWSVGLFVLLSSGCWSRSFDGIIRDCLCEASRDIPNVPSVPEPPSYIVIHCHTPTTVFLYFSSQYTAVAIDTHNLTQSVFSCSRHTLSFPFYAVERHWQFPWNVKLFALSCVLARDTTRGVMQHPYLV